jgi:membrane-associated phospholipid phosphatase
LKDICISSGKLALKRFILSSADLLIVTVLCAQTIQTYTYRDSIVVYPPGCYQKFEAKKFIVPGVLIAYGFLARHTDALSDLSESVQKLVWVDNPHNKTTIDNYLQFAPAVAVYALNIAGIKGENNFVDMSMIYLMSNIIMEGFVTTIKHTSHELRPNESDFQSYPSGHTAEAFLSATFLYEEYKNVSPWYGIGGYLVAGTVGYLRIYNNAHWLHDVVAGAGYGIASTEFSYWLYPLMKRTFFPKSCGKKMFVPVMENHGAGISYVQLF